MRRGRMSSHKVFGGCPFITLQIVPSQHRVGDTCSCMYSTQPNDAMSHGFPPPAEHALMLAVALRPPLSLVFHSRVSADMQVTYATS